MQVIVVSGPEQLTRLLLIRHGHHDPGGRFLQHACTGLTEIGVAQAEALAARLARDDTLTLMVVLASKARRSIDTARILATRLGVSLADCTCDLCEMHPGAAEGLTPAEMERQFGPSYQFVPGAEHFPRWIPTACAALERIATVYRGRQIIAVSHGGVIRASFVAFGRMPLAQASQIWSANTGMTEWSSVPSRDAPTEDLWRLERHNDVAHLIALTGHDIEG
jgi:probable phosphoglycerate mutase